MQVGLRLNLADQVANISKHICMQVASELFSATLDPYV